MYLVDTMGTYNGDSSFSEQSAHAVPKDQHYAYPPGAGWSKHG